MTRLYLVRHGDATGEGADSGLSPLGSEQSRLLGDRLRDEMVVEVRHSPRRRAVETAAVLGQLCGTPTAVDPLLDDRTPVPTPGEESLYPARMSAWFAGVPEDERDAGGARLSAALAAGLADDRQLVLVTHAFVIAWFVRQVLGAPVRDLAGRGLPTPWSEVDWDAEPGWEWRSAAEDSPEQLYALLADAVGRSRAAVADALARGMDGLSYPPGGSPFSLRVSWST